MKTLLIYVYDTCCVSEVSIINWMVKTEEKWDVQMIGPSKNPIRSLEGWKIIPDMAVSEFNDTEDVVGLLFPGGFDIIVSSELKTLIHEFDTKKKLLGAICAGPTHLALAGILSNYKYTTSRSLQYYAENEEEEDPFPRDNYIEIRSIVDQHVITSKGEALLDFADKIFQYLQVFSNPDDYQEFRKSFSPTWE